MIALQRFGFRTCLAPQELIIFGSSFSRDHLHYLKRPYMPLAVQNGEATAEQCNLYRILAGGCIATLPRRWKVNYAEGVMSLEPLNAQGETIRDPTLLVVDTTYSLRPSEREFPFQRDPLHFNCVIRTRH